MRRWFRGAAAGTATRPGSARRGGPAVGDEERGRQRRRQPGDGQGRRGCLGRAWAPHSANSGESRDTGVVSGVIRAAGGRCRLGRGRPAASRGPSRRAACPPGSPAGLSPGCWSARAGFMAASRRADSAPGSPPSWAALPSVLLAFPRLLLLACRIWFELRVAEFDLAAAVQEDAEEDVIGIGRDLGG